MAFANSLQIGCCCGGGGGPTVPICGHEIPVNLTLTWTYRSIDDGIPLGDPRCQPPNMGDDVGSMTIPLTYDPAFGYWRSPVVAMGSGHRWCATPNPTQRPIFALSGNIANYNVQFAFGQHGACLMAMGGATSGTPIVGGPAPGDGNIGLASAPVSWSPLLFSRDFSTGFAGISGQQFDFFDITG